jgi:hypothetical protein
VTIAPETLVWLHQSAAVDGAAYSQVLLHLLERVEALEADATEQSQSSSFCNEAIVRRVEALERRPIPGLVDSLWLRKEAAPTPEAAPVATDEELLELAGQRLPIYALRACYNLGRKHGAAAAQPTPPAAPAGGLVERVEMALQRSYTLENDWSAEACAAIREVAAWLRADAPQSCPLTARWLEQEANR